MDSAFQSAFRKSTAKEISFVLASAKQALTARLSEEQQRCLASFDGLVRHTFVLSDDPSRGDDAEHWAERSRAFVDFVKKTPKDDSLPAAWRLLPSAWAAVLQQGDMKVEDMVQ